MSRRTPTRLAAMPGIRARLTCALAVAAGAFLLAACGGGEDGTIPQDAGDQLLARLASIEEAVNSGNCETARIDAVELTGAVNSLPDDVDPEVKQGLIQAAAQLQKLTEDPTQCVEPDTGTTDVIETTTSTSSSTTSTTESTTSTTHEETTDPDAGPPADTPGNGNPGGPNSPGGDDFEGGSSGGIGADE